MPIMAKLSRESLVKRVFSDPKNYPYGFSRSGDFSINESKALSQVGFLVVALVDGHLEPETDEEHGLMAAAFGQKVPETAGEKAWVKYQKRINRPKLVSFYGTKRTALEEDDDDVDEDSSLEIEVDD
jgi:uncharacterized protein YifE (UPF0438 family)